MFIQRKRNVQNGRGIGSILSTVFRKIAPYAKTIINTGQRILSSKPAQNVLESGKQSIAKASVRVLDDVLQGKKVKESLKEHLSTTMNDVKDRVLQEAKAQVSAMYKDNPGKKVEKRKVKDSQK